ncbi:MAG: proline dehydrogenase family protein [Prevotellaceae bacterium]|nr:proline dehydrogenase family protein [Prevotellaceae bacterium]
MTDITVKEVIVWAKDFLLKADAELAPDEKRERKKFASLVQTPEYKIFLSKMLDESSQIKDNRILNARVRGIIRQYGIPDFFGFADRLLIRAYLCGGFLFPSVAMPVFKMKLRRETDKIIIAEERPDLTEHLAERTRDRIGQNVNLLGEVVLGDGEARQRYLHYLEALEAPDINYISIKLSGIYARINPLSYERNKSELCELLAEVYRKAMAHPYTDVYGAKHSKFVNLDMEEYKDAELTLDVFEATLNRPEFLHYTAGIVVQAYLPDASGFQRRLLEFARRRTAAGGAHVKMRLVKGANLQMETVVSSLRGWESPVYRSKTETDANFLHLLDTALLPENAKACRVGVASHNYFSIAYAHLLAERNGTSDYLTFEMLEGMANNLPRVMRKLKKQIVLYTPVVRREHFLNAVSYLVRRLDENTGKENFLSYSFNLKIDSPQWAFLEQQFVDAFRLKDTVRTAPFRTQDRNMPPAPQIDVETFANEPDTDLDLPQNRKWALRMLDKWMNEVDGSNFKVRVQVGDREFASANIKQYRDRSRNDEKVICEACLASPEQTDEIIAVADRDASGWRRTSLDERNRILHRTADRLNAKRGDLIGCMAAVTGKIFAEGDTEVSEAIDFCRYYPVSMRRFEELPLAACAPKGVVMVISPWNFPLAIPVGGVAAALTGGNTVILKPATAALPVAALFASCFWEAGVPKDALQVVCPAERDSLTNLVSHPSIKHVILTGGTDTAFRLLKNRPRTPLSAETGGKNAIIVTASADRDHAVLNVVSSAFGNAGQKCSACSLLLVDRKTYNDESFRSKLRDAVTSLRAGSVWDTMNFVGPMIDNNNEKLMRAIERLDEGESWLVAPEFADEKKYILKPTVKWGVRPSSYTFKTELFAPLLSVVCIDSLEQGAEYVNSLDFGLTSGLQSLDEAEHERWKNSVEAGNLYINRGITGAIVRRQPFGGMKRSAFGGGLKAGGPNYVSSFVEFAEKPVPAPAEVPLANDPLNDLLELVEDENDRNRVNYAYFDFRRVMSAEFSGERDVCRIYGEENVLRYLPLKRMALRVQAHDGIAGALLCMIAAHTAKTPLTVSFSGDDRKRGAILRAAALLRGGITTAIQSETEFIAEFAANTGACERLRSLSPEMSDAFYRQAAGAGIHVADSKPLVEGRIELLHYLKEQSASREYHRYGSVFDARFFNIEQE